MASAMHNPAIPVPAAEEGESLNLAVLKEVHHRVANTFAMMAAIVRREFSQYGDPSLQTAIERHENYIAAQGELYRCLLPEAKSFLPVESHFKRLFAAIEKALFVPSGIRCNFETDAGMLAAGICQALSFIVVELATNAAKHAFAHQPAPIVSIRMVRYPGHWSFMMADNGSGLPDAVLAGQGSQIIEAAARSINALVTLSSSPNGTITVIEIPE